MKEHDRKLDKFYEKKNIQWDKIMKFIYPNIYKNKPNKKDDNN